mmetsp:Transcript_32534/g.63547  ORF Transcript_32534/g.63547 Transcript_32534/m.63547 type:complete len:232 (-) Transcript_32534:112-807(-)
MGGDVVPPVAPERQRARQQNIHEAPHAPDIRLVVVLLLPLQQLGRDVVERAAVLVQVLVLAQLREAEVGDAQTAVRPLMQVEDVLRLEVAVHDAPLVHVGARVQHVRYHGRHLPLGVPHALRELSKDPLHQLPSRSKLHDDPVLALLLRVFQVVVELDDVGVRHHEVRGHLLRDPGLELFSAPVLLPYDALGRILLACLPMLCLPHLTIVALPQLLTQLVGFLHLRFSAHA